MNGKNTLLIVFLLACFIDGFAAENETVTVHDAWIAEGPPVVKIHAGYVEIENAGRSDVILNEVTSPNFERIEIHRSVTVDGIAKMQYQESVTIPANGHLSFAPGGYHLMLFDARKPIRAGETVSLSFFFNNGEAINAEAKIKTMRHEPHSH